MSSFNHYASGAVGDFLYKRVLGVQPTSGGYKTFTFKPLIGGGITCAKGELETPYGTIAAEWKSDNGGVKMNIVVPAGATCEVVTPSGMSKTVCSGSYSFEE